MNHPSANVCCPCIPPNSCCPGYDCIYKTYYDRGVFDQQDLCHCTGCVSGSPTFYGGARKFVCCCAGEF